MPQTALLVRRGQAKRQGQTMVEFALVFVLLFMVLLGVIEIGHLVTVYAVTIMSSREAARYGAAVGPSETNPALLRYEDCDGITQAALRLGWLAGMQPADIEIQYDHGPGTASFASCPPPDVSLGDRIVVTVQGHYRPWVPLFPRVDLTFQSTTCRTIYRNIPTQ